MTTGPLVDAQTAALAAGVQLATLRDWRRRGLLEPVDGTPRRPLYALPAVLAAVRAAKPRREPGTLGS